jgi:hypothetical protein
LEPLEDRWVPAVTISEVGSTLTVQGDTGKNLIVIEDNGGNAKGSIVVVTPGGNFKSKRAVAHINVLAGDAKDIVQYTLTGTLQAGIDRHVFISMGNGVDQPCSVTLNGGVAAKASLDIVVEGGEQQDRIAFNGTGNVAAGGYLGVHLFGNGGSDHIRASYTGQVAGGLSIRAEGGGGYNSVVANVTASSGSTGRLWVHVLGGSEPDFVELLATKSNPADKLSLDLLADGGGGTNRGLVTPNVVTKNIQGLQIKVK